MELNKTYISNNNSYANQTPKYIVIHNTDNFSAGADAKAHASAQYNGNFDGMSAHVYVDDKSAYQATPFNRGAWHVGVDYGGRLFGTVTNRNSVAIEICVQKGYDYSKAYKNAVEVCRQLMKELGIPADRVVQHYDVCGKNCPSAIRSKGDWENFKKAIRGEAVQTPKKDNAVDLTDAVSVQLPEISKGCTGVGVSMLQTLLGVEVDGIFGDETENSFKAFQGNTNQAKDGICGKNGWAAVAAHMNANTFK